jgi:hypothetical protein
MTRQHNNYRYETGGSITGGFPRHEEMKPVH